MSTTATGLPPTVEVYLAALREELADLASEERDDLLSEVQPSLLEAAAEGDEPIAARLGAPADFAADLRASAGLRAAVARLAATPAIRRAAPVLHELAPVWWAARAYFATGLLAIIAGVDWSARYPGFPRFGSEIGTGVLLAIAFAVSVMLGLRARAAGLALRRTAIALNVLLVVAAALVLARAADPPLLVSPYESFTMTPPPGLSNDGIAIENVYPYDRKGRLLHDVRLYDQLGRPLNVRMDDPDRRPVRDRDGKTALNAFPIRYFDPRTRHVARPNAAPEVSTPPLKTPKLK
jgi:hypothetical protein